MAPRSASLYRMVMDKHVCPWGLKARWLLRREGYRVDDHWLRTREQTDAFKAEHGVETTPQTFIDGLRIGGYDDLRRWLGKPVKDPEATSYRPVIALFGMAAAMALALGWLIEGAPWQVGTLGRFIALAMCLLAVQKLQDVDGFATMFLGYDLLARRWVPYAYLFPFLEALAGVLMLAQAGTWLAAPVAIFIGGIGSVSVFYAVYVQKREIKCACVGGGSRVPLGFVSLTEDLMMVAMGLWMALA
ncbi:glutaredoxin [Pseudoxanthomonas sp. JBR18]|uniref:glutaredoxin n=1 Tax=Pseudoxanthomonas sp. JBR18 TaxID=2969308 RepID=UPI0023069BF3|nr:glutaredoxin [Pseudoxanthomonas sp. JBR18]WCE02588.1 glutaredoxin [Pseudoxanthomonas sp. JBR18]